MNATVEVWLEDDRRFIRQRIDGDVDIHDFKRLEEQTRELAKQLIDPNAVLALLDARTLGAATFRARREMLRPLEEPEFHRLAVYGAPRLARLIGRFMSTILGLHKVRMFAGEKEAIEWLVS